MRVTSATPFNQETSLGPKLRSPSQINKIRSKASYSAKRGSVFSSITKDLPSPSQAVEINYPRVPVVCIRNTRTPNSRYRVANYLKFIPKPLEIKPLFHSRIKTYKAPSFENDYLNQMKSNTPNLNSY